MLSVSLNKTFLSFRAVTYPDDNEDDYDDDGGGMIIIAMTMVA